MLGHFVLSLPSCQLFSSPKSLPAAFAPARGLHILAYEAALWKIGTVAKASRISAPFQAACAGYVGGKGAGLRRSGREAAT